MKRFVSEEFLDLLGKSSVEEVSLGDHTARDMSVMFADIRQFTAIAERLQPEETFRFINRYLALMGPAIRAHGGFVDKYVGDGIVALFGGSPENAVRCAIEMQRRLAEYNAERAASGEAPIRIGIGIHYGRLMIGTIGENERMDGTVVSDVANLAHRIEGVTKEFSVGLAVSERVLLGLCDPGSYGTRFLGKIGLRGTRAPLSVFEVYEGAGEKERSTKNAIKADFEAALERFYTQDYEVALEKFRKVLETAPEDEASQHYMRIIRRLRLA